MSRDMCHCLGHIVECNNIGIHNIHPLTDRNTKYLSVAHNVIKNPDLKPYDMLIYLDMSNNSIGDICQVFVNEARRYLYRLNLNEN